MGTLKVPQATPLATSLPLVLLAPSPFPFHTQSLTSKALPVPRSAAGHEESYNPPVEYIPSEEEVAQKKMEAEYEGSQASLFIPRK